MTRDKLREALQAHHDWHLAQTDEDEHGIVLAEAYSESALCDQTVAALATTPDQAVMAERERCAQIATSFLVGDPKNGVPLRNPMPHEIADRIRAQGEPK